MWFTNHTQTWCKIDGNQFVFLVFVYDGWMKVEIKQIESYKVMKQLSLVWQLGVGSVASVQRPPVEPACWPLTHPSVGVDPRLTRAEVRGQGWRPGLRAWGRGVELKARSLSWVGYDPCERNSSCWTHWRQCCVVIQKILFMSNRF